MCDIQQTGVADLHRWPLGHVDKLTTGGFTDSPGRDSTLIFGMEIGFDPRTADGR
jgi:hypothetical protein